MSSAASNPTDRRIKLSLMPIFSRTSGGTLPCVIVAGCSINVSRLPKLTANVAKLDTIQQAELLPHNLPPQTQSCHQSHPFVAAPIRIGGSFPSRGNKRPLPPSCASKNCATAIPLSQCCFIRSGSVFAPKLVSQQSKGLGTPPR